MSINAIRTAPEIKSLEKLPYELFLVTLLPIKSSLLVTTVGVIVESLSRNTPSGAFALNRILNSR